VSHVGLDQQAAHEDRLEVAPAEFAVAEGANADASAAHLLVVAVLAGAFVGDVDVVALVGEGFESVVERDASPQHLLAPSLYLALSLGWRYHVGNGSLIRYGITGLVDCFGTVQSIKHLWLYV
jgi:hypothetical protein